MEAPPFPSHPAIVRSITLLKRGISLDLLNVHLRNLAGFGIAGQESRNAPVVLDDLQNDVRLSFDGQVELMRNLSQRGRLVR